MTTELELTRAVRDWLEDGPTAIPDRVLDAVMDGVPQTGQRRRPRLAIVAIDRRRARLLQLAAALVILAILAAGLLVGAGALRRPSPGPFELPTAAQPLPSARYALAPPFGLPLALDVPDGWSTVEVGPGWIELASRSPAPGTLAFTFVDAIYADPCLHDRGLLSSVGRTAADLARALERRPGLDVTHAVPTVVDGRQAIRLTITAPDSFDGCAEPAPQFRVWGLPEEPVLSESQRDHLWIVDAGIDRLVIHGVVDPATSSQTIAEMESIIRSIGFGERAVLPAPSHAATPRPTDPPFLTLPPSGPVDEGAYLTTMATYEFDVHGDATQILAQDEVVFWGPGGWLVQGNRLVSDVDGPPDASFGWWAIRRVYADPCRWRGSEIAEPSTVGKDSVLAAAIAEPHAARVTTTPWSGRRTPYLEFTVPLDLDLATCDDGGYRLWQDHDGRVRTAYPGEHIRVRVVDVDPGIAVLEYGSMPAASLDTIDQLTISGPDISLTRVSGP